MEICQTIYRATLMSIFFLCFGGRVSLIVSLSLSLFLVVTNVPFFYREMKFE